MSERSGVTEPGRLHFTVGLPQSGKSTYCNDWMRHYYQTTPGPTAFRLWTHVAARPYGQTLELAAHPRAVVGGDDFRHALHGQEYRPEAEGAVFAAMDVAARAMLRRGFDVMMDETCTTQSTLLRYLRMDQGAVPHFIDVPAEVCVKRALAAGRPYLVGPIGRMAEQLVALKADWDNVVKKLLSYVEMRKGLDVAV